MDRCPGSILSGVSGYIRWPDRTVARQPRGGLATTVRGKMGLFRSLPGEILGHRGLERNWGYEFSLILDAPGNSPRPRHGPKSRFEMVAYVPNPYLKKGCDDHSIIVDPVSHRPERLRRAPREKPEKNPIAG